MCDLVVPLIDIERLAKIAPEMPAHQVAEMMRWIAEEVRPPRHDIKLAPPSIEIAAGDCLDMGDGPISIEPQAQPVQEAASEDRTWQPWGDEEKQLLLKCHNNGVKVRHIAERLGRGLSATRKMLDILRADQINGRGAPLTNRGPWTEDEKAKARQLRDKGLKYSQIADEMKRPIRSVSSMFHRDKLPASAPTPAPRPALVKPAPGPGAGVMAKPISPAPKADPVVAPTPTPAPAALTGAQRDMMARLMRLDDDFTPEDDLYLAGAIISRTPLDVIADQLGCDSATVRTRWCKLLGFDPKTRPGGVPLQLQSDLMLVLRQLVGEAAA